MQIFNFDGGPLDGAKFECGADDIYPMHFTVEIPSADCKSTLVAEYAVVHSTEDDRSRDACHFTAFISSRYKQRDHQSTAEAIAAFDAATPSP